MTYWLEVYGLIIVAGLVFALPLTALLMLGTYAYSLLRRVEKSPRLWLHPGGEIQSQTCRRAHRSGVVSSGVCLSRRGLCYRGKPARQGNEGGERSLITGLRDNYRDGGDHADRTNRSGIASYRQRPIHRSRRDGNSWPRLCGSMVSGIRDRTNDSKDPASSRDSLSSR